MTREEAVKILKSIKEEYDCPYDIEALDMAIEDLQTEPCEDAISRQAAIDAVEKSRRLNYHQDGKEACAHEYEHRSFLKILHDLPSVQPEQKVGKWIFHKSFDNGHKNCNECIECSQCHTWLGHDCYAKTPYCPMCGAKMEEGE